MTVLVDAYPTRDQSPWAINERRDPVIYGGTDGPLGREHLAFFEENGYLQLTGLMEDRLDELVQEADRLRDRAAPGDERVIIEPEGQAVRSVFGCHWSSDRFRLVAASKLADIARQILGGDVYIHQSRINFKPGFEGKEFYWHSDFETWHAEDGMPRMRAVSCVISLTHNTEQNGPLMIIPGSHRHYVKCEGITPENHYKKSLRQQEIGVPPKPALEKLVAWGGIESMKGPAGGVVFFDCNAMHGSFGNLTPFPRNNLFMVYNSVENTLVEPFCGRSPRPDHIASRDFTPVGQ